MTTTTTYLLVGDEVTLPAAEELGLAGFATHDAAASEVRRVVLCVEVCNTNKQQPSVTSYYTITTMITLSLWQQCMSASGCVCLHDQQTALTLDPVSY